MFLTLLSAFGISQDTLISLLFITSESFILWSCWVKKYSSEIMKSSKGFDDKTHLRGNIGKMFLSSCSYSICSVCISGEEQGTEAHVSRVLANRSGACSPSSRD